MRRADPTDVHSPVALGAELVRDAAPDRAAAAPEADAVLDAVVLDWERRAEALAAAWCPTSAGGAAAATSVVISVIYPVSGSS